MTTANRKTAMGRVADGLHKICCTTKFVLSLFAAGITFCPARLMMAINGIEVPEEAEFYRVQPKVVKTVMDMARESANKAFQSLGNVVTVAIDGSWSHRRNAIYCIVDAIDIATKKIVDYYVVVRRVPGVTDHSFNFEGAANQMEGEGERHLLRRLQASGKVVSLWG
jgi:hypothetical protein